LGDAGGALGPRLKKCNVKERLPGCGEKPGKKRCSERQLTCEGGLLHGEKFSDHTKKKKGEEEKRERSVSNWKGPERKKN